MCQLKVQGGSLNGKMQKKGVSIARILCDSWLFLICALIMMISLSSGFHPKIKSRSRYCQQRSSVEHEVSFGEISRSIDAYAEKMKDSIFLQNSADMEYTNKLAAIMMALWGDSLKDEDVPKVARAFDMDESIIKAMRNQQDFCNNVISSSPSQSEQDDDLLTASTDIDSTVLYFTKNWVRAMIADFAVCPFSLDAELAGIPRGKVRYTLSYATTMKEAFTSFWEEIMVLSTTTTKEVATVLLIYPYVSSFADFEVFSDFTSCLDDIMEDPVLDLDDKFNNVYFHRDYRFKDKDGQAIIIFDDDGEPIGSSADIITPVSYARRSPWPIVNILRSPMVKASQKGVPEGRVFDQNSIRLSAVGTPSLQAMLDNLDWSDLPKHSPHAIRESQLRLKQNENIMQQSNDVASHPTLSRDEENKLIAELDKWLAEE